MTSTGVKCPNCKGSKWSTPCAMCDGTGEITIGHSKTLELLRDAHRDTRYVLAWFDKQTLAELDRDADGHRILNAVREGA